MIEQQKQYPLHDAGHGDCGESGKEKRKKSISIAYVEAISTFMSAGACMNEHVFIISLKGGEMAPPCGARETLL